MLRAWQKRLLNNRLSVEFEFATAGSHTQVIDAGIYDIWLVGGGGGGAMVGKTLSNTKRWARGGVGGVLYVRVKVPIQTTITVNVGAGGNSRIGSNDDVITGNNGNNTTITGFSNVILKAGAGTGATVSGQDSRTAGVQGTNTATGSNVLSVIENNINTITSTTGVSSSTKRTTTGQLNINWAEDTQKGLGGDIGWTTPANIVFKHGGTGFVRIKSVD